MSWTGSRSVSDVLVPAAVLAVGLVELGLTRLDGWAYGAFLELAAATLLVWRRRFPMAAVPVAAGVLLFMPWVGPQLSDLATPIVFVALMGYTAGRWVSDYRGLWVVGAIMLMLVVDLVAVDARVVDVTDLVFALAILAPPYVFGRVSRRLALQAEELIVHQDRERAHAVQEERDRIARDLHDVVAHSISAMVVQTAAAEDLVRTDPERAGELLSEVATTGRRALAETGRLLHVIRDDADELGLSPAPGLADVPGLVHEFRRRGLAVSAELPTPLPVLPGGVDVSVFRIVQEALTNSLRYAPDRSASLRVASNGNAVTVRVANRSNGRSGEGSGLGLLGVAERVKVLGGSLSRTEDGGRFELEVSLPMGLP